jgi:hypothetical protein
MNIATRDLFYRDLDTSLTGLFCWNDALEGPRPGILLVHGGAGLDAHARDQACRYAALGYAVLACDMFGDGIAGDRERVMACLLALRDDPARAASATTGSPTSARWPPPAPSSPRPSRPSGRGTGSGRRRASARRSGPRRLDVQRVDLVAVQQPDEQADRHPAHLGQRQLVQRRRRPRLRRRAELTAD